MSDVGNIYSTAFENLFNSAGYGGQRKMTGRHSRPENTRTDPQSDRNPQPYRDEENSNELHPGHYTTTNEQGYQNLDYYNTNTDSNYWEDGRESNYDNYDYEPSVVENQAQQGEDLSLHQQEYTSSEAPYFDYSSYEYDYVPNYLDETAEDDFRYQVRGS